MLSEAARRVWGKSSPMGARTIDQLELWMPVWRHLQDAAAVAGRLWDCWLPPLVKRQFGDACGGELSARTLLCFLASAHDVGKATPAFAVQVPALRDPMVLAGLDMPKESRSLPNRASCPHGLAGQVIVEQWLVLRHQWESKQAIGLASVVGGHHGIPPNLLQLDKMRGGRRSLTGELIGSGKWVDVQNELLDHMAQLTNATSFLATQRWRGLPERILVLALAVVVVADWIASNSALFPLTDVVDVVPLPQPDSDDVERLERAWQALHLPRPWTIRDVCETADALLEARFDYPPSSIRPVQQAVVDAANEMDAAGILIVEAPMGEGKTEAAMMAAEILARRTGAGGVMVALPTQATSDAMFARVMRWIAHQPVTHSGSAVVPDQETESGRRSVFLAHGKAWLNSDYRAVPRGRSLTHDIGRDEPLRNTRDTRVGVGGAYVDGWMTGRKGVLADFVVGTIDQILFMALQARHVALRHLAFARKVVILDEVHSFDAFMNVYLERAIEWLGAYGVPVVALSATLPSALRQRLVEAYQKGAARSSGQPKSSLNESLGSSSSVVTYTKDGVARSCPVEGVSRAREVVLETAADDAVPDLLANALQDGGCALVIRNTVASAQDTFQRLVSLFGDDVVLLHSRFLALDRKAKEAALVAKLGKPPAVGETDHRPARLVVVATQVMEQSLDVDFDLLITDLAPTDLMLQRIGRLHRHGDRSPESRPKPVRIARCVVVGVDDWAASPPVPKIGSSKVYGASLLYRASAQVLDIVNADGVIRLPQDIAPLVEAAYGDRELGPSSWQPKMSEARNRALRELAKKRRDAGKFRLPSPSSSEFGLTGWLDENVGEAEVGATRARVRDGGDAFGVLVVQGEPAGPWRIPDWLSSSHRGEPLLMEDLPPHAQRLALAGTSVSLPRWVCEGSRGLMLIEALESLMRPAWQLSPDLAGELVLPLDENCQWQMPDLLPDLLIEYDPLLGMTVRRPDGDRGN